MKARALACLEVAEYTIQRLKDIGIDAWRNPNALTVVFPEPPASLRIKWQLASENRFTHIICMPGVGKEKIDDFVDEIKTHVSLPVA